MSRNTDRSVYRRGSDQKWVDKRNNAERGSVHNTQAEAITSARSKIERAGGGELTVMGRDGRIRSKDTLGGGNDPMPPRDREH